MPTIKETILVKRYEVEREARKIGEKIAKALHTTPVPIETKLGGWTAAYYPVEHVIKVRVDSWLKMLPAQKKLTLIHEYLHAIGYSHTIKISFLGFSDLLSIEIYKKIWGEDRDLIDLFEIVKEESKKIVGG